MSLSQIRLAFGLFSLLLVAIILAANTGHIGFIGRAVHEIPHGDKLGHFLLMGTLAFLANLSLVGRSIQFRGKPVILLGSAIVLVLVTLEELSQRFIPNRTLDGGDLLADYLGILLFGKLASLVVKSRLLTVT